MFHNLVVQIPSYLYSTAIGFAGVILRQRYVTVRQKYSIECTYDSFQVYSSLQPKIDSNQLKGLRRVAAALLRHSAPQSN